MKSSTPLCAISAVVCASAAAGAFQGGVVLTNDAWNTAATTAIGEAVTVTRMYALFDEPDDIALVIGSNLVDGDFGGNNFMRLREGRTLYQDPFGGTTTDQIQQVTFSQRPAIEWDSYLGLGNVTDSVTSVPTDRMAFTSNGLRATESPHTATWFGIPGATPNREPGFYPGDAGFYGSYDTETGLYALFLGQMTVLGEHAEFESIADAGIASDRMRSQLFSGRLSVHWEEADTGGPVILNGMIFEIPAPGAAGVFGIACVCAARRRR